MEKENNSMRPGNFENEKHKARKICAWCKNDLGEAEGSIGDDTHVICPECAQKVRSEQIAPLKEKK